MKVKNLLLTISIIALIVFFVVLMYGIISAPHGAGSEDRGHPVIPTYIISISSIVLIIGLIPLFYYIIYTGLEKNYEKKMEILSKTLGDNKKVSEVNDDSKINFTNVILKFLSYNEKKVLNKLIEQKGPILQSEISRLEGMGKVKTHRVIKDLEIKGIIVVEKYGNTNRITLSQSLSKIFK